MTDGSMHADYARGRDAEGRGARAELVYRYRFRALAAIRSAPMLRGGRLLDLGAAEGRTLGEMMRLGGPAQAVGVEISADLVELASRLGFPVIVGDVQDLPPEIRARRFDVVTAMAVLEHLPDPAAALRSAFEVLAPGGRLIASAPSPFWDRLAGASGIHKEQAHHVHEVDGAFFRRLASDAGFVRIRTRPFMFVGTAFLPYIGLVPPVELAQRLEAPFSRFPFSPLFINQLFIADRP
jgi:2-polyprenyl-3-methyl-5-hydroxy-6-metoxy-1,4-benzoquinol methylase